MKIEGFIRKDNNKDLKKENVEGQKQDQATQKIEEIKSPLALGEVEKIKTELEKREKLQMLVAACRNEASRQNIEYAGRENKFVETYVGHPTYETVRQNVRPADYTKAEIYRKSIIELAAEIGIDANPYVTQESFANTSETSGKLTDFINDNEKNILVLKKQLEK